MSLSKKDKIVLITLVFVLVFAIFIMYGIMPVSNELKEAEKKHEELKKEVDALVQEYNNPANKPENIEDKIEKSLMSYYQNDKPGIVVRDEESARVSFFEKIGGNLVTNGGIVLNIDLDTIQVETESVSYDNGGVEPVSISLLKASVPCYFTIEVNQGLDRVSEVFNFINGLEDFMYEKISITRDADNHKYNGSFYIYKHYIKNPENLPLPLVDDYTKMDITEVADAPEVTTFNYAKKYIKFNTIKNAKYYEIYEVVEAKENDKITYNFALVDSNIESENGYDVTYYYEGKLQSDKKYVVTAVGNYKDAEAVSKGEKLYYRTILTDYLAEKNFTVM